MSEEADSPTEPALAAALDPADPGVDIDETASQSTDQIPDEILQHVAVSRGYRSDIVASAARHLFQQSNSLKEAWGFAYQLEKEWQERLASTEQAPAQMQQQEAFLENMRIRRQLIERLDALLNTPPFLLPLASKGLVGTGDALEILVIYKSLMEIGRKIGEEVVSQVDSGWHKTYVKGKIDALSAIDKESEDALGPRVSSAEEGTSSPGAQKSHDERTVKQVTVSKNRPMSTFEQNTAAGFSKLHVSSADPGSLSMPRQDEDQQPDLAKVEDGQESSAAPLDIRVADAGEEAELEQDLVHIKEALSHNPAFRSELVTSLHQILNEEQDPKRMERKVLIEGFLAQWADADLSLMHEAKAEIIRIVTAAVKRRSELFSKIKAWFAAKPDAISRAASNQVAFEGAVELAEFHAELASVEHKIHRCISMFMKVEKASEMADVGDQGGEPLSQAGEEKDAE